MGYARILWREAVRNWRARFKSEGIRLTKYLVGFAALFALVVVAPPLDTFGIKWQIAAAAVTASGIPAYFVWKRLAANTQTAA